MHPHLLPQQIRLTTGNRPGSPTSLQGRPGSLTRKKMIMGKKEEEMKITKTIRQSSGLLETTTRGTANRSMTTKMRETMIRGKIM